MTKEEAIKVIRKMLAVTDLTVRGNMTSKMVEACNVAIKMLKQPEREKGKWIWWYEETEKQNHAISKLHCKCSKCGKEHNPHTIPFINFCCHCGADMRGKVEE